MVYHLLLQYIIGCWNYLLNIITLRWDTSLQVITNEQISIVKNDLLMLINVGFINNSFLFTIFGSFASFHFLWILCYSWLTVNHGLFMQPYGRVYSIKTVQSKPFFKFFLKFLKKIVFVLEKLSLWQVMIG